MSEELIIGQIRIDLDTGIEWELKEDLGGSVVRLTCTKPISGERHMDKCAWLGLKVLYTPLRMKEMESMNEDMKKLVNKEALIEVGEVRAVIQDVMKEFRTAIAWSEESPSNNLRNCVTELERRLLSDMGIVED